VQQPIALGAEVVRALMNPCTNVMIPFSALLFALNQVGFT
jgi:3-methyladenine DNA glycosylase AlkC